MIASALYCLIKGLGFRKLCPCFVLCSFLGGLCTAIPAFAEESLALFLSPKEPAYRLTDSAELRRTARNRINNLLAVNNNGEVIIKINDISFDICYNDVSREVVAMEQLRRVRSQEDPYLDGFSVKVGIPF